MPEQHAVRARVQIDTDAKRADRAARLHERAVALMHTLPSTNHNALLAVSEYTELNTNGVSFALAVFSYPGRHGFVVEWGDGRFFTERLHPLPIPMRIRISAQEHGNTTDAAPVVQKLVDTTNYLDFLMRCKAPRVVFRNFGLHRAVTQEVYSQLNFTKE